MTVRELINQLADCDPDTVVLTYDPGCEGMLRGYRDAHRLLTVHVAPRGCNTIYPQFKKHERNTVAGVWLTW